jgi:O-antigen/teichoic acid export membrane protein
MSWTTAWRKNMITLDYWAIGLWFYILLITILVPLVSYVGPILLLVFLLLFWMLAYWYVRDHFIVKNPVKSEI